MSAQWWGDVLLDIEHNLSEEARQVWMMKGRSWREHTAQRVADGEGSVIGVVLEMESFAARQQKQKQEES